MRRQDSPSRIHLHVEAEAPDFLATMTDQERAIMAQHTAYTQKLFDQGKIVMGGAATDGARWAGKI